MAGKAMGTCPKCNQPCPINFVAYVTDKNGNRRYPKKGKAIPLPDCKCGK